MAKQIIRFTGSTVQWIKNWQIEQEIPMSEKYLPILVYLKSLKVDHFSADSELSTYCLFAVCSGFSIEQVKKTWPIIKVELLQSYLDLFGAFYNDYVEKAEAMENKVNL